MQRAINFKTRSATKDEMQMYLLVGEAICSLQILEDELIKAITIHDCETSPDSKKGEEVLNKYRDFGFGQAVSKVKEKSLLTEEIRSNLVFLREERNWLVHRGIYQSLDETTNGMTLSQCKEKLFKRLSKIISQIHGTSKLMTEDLVEKLQKSGKNTTNLVNSLEEFWNETD